MAKIKESVFCLHTYNDYTGERAYGSGFIIQAPPRAAGENETYSYLVTNLHMVEGMRDGEILNSDDARFKVYGLVHADILNDIAVLRVPYIRTTQELKPEPIDSPHPALDVGDEIAVFGYPTYPAFIDGALSTGIVSAFVRKRNEVTGNVVTQFLQVTAQVSKGSSGSPVFNRAGQVVGIITKRFLPDSGDGTDAIGIAALSGSINKLLVNLQSRPSAVVPLQYIRTGFKPEDLDAVITEEFRQFTEADQNDRKGQKHEFAKKLLEIADQSALVHFQMGITKNQLALTDEAIQSLTRATEIDPNYYQAWFQLGYICITKHSKMVADKVTIDSNLVTTAIKACRNARKILNIAASNYMLGEALLLDNKQEEAAKYYQEAYHQNPDDPVVLVAHFHMLGLQNKYTEARELLAKVEAMKDQLENNAAAKMRFENTAKKIRSR